MSPKKKQAGISWAGLKNEWSAWYIKKAPVIVFALKFGLLIGLLYLLLDLPLGDRLLYAYLEANAYLVNIFLGLLGQHTHVSDGVVIQSPRFAMAIRRGCDAVEPTWLLCAAILAFPASVVKKTGGILLAIVVLQLLNLLRLASLYWIGIYMPAFFNSAHMEVWPVIFILVAILYFLRWKGVFLEQTRASRA